MSEGKSPIFERKGLFCTDISDTNRNTPTDTDMDSVYTLQPPQNPHFEQQLPQSPTETNTPILNWDQYWSIDTVRSNTSILNTYTSTIRSNTPTMERNTPSSRSNTPILDRKTPSSRSNTPTIERKILTKDKNTPTRSNTPTMERNTPSRSNTPTMDKNTSTKDRNTPSRSNTPTMGKKTYKKDKNKGKNTISKNENIKNPILSALQDIPGIEFTAEELAVFERNKDVVL